MEQRAPVARPDRIGAAILARGRLPNRGIARNRLRAFPNRTPDTLPIGRLVRSSPTPDLRSPDSRRRLLTDVEDRADVRVTHLRQRSRFTLEALLVIDIAGKVRGQHLDGHRSLESRIACAIDLAHAAMPDPFAQSSRPPDWRTLASLPLATASLIRALTRSVKCRRTPFRARSRRPRHGAQGNGVQSRFRRLNSRRV